MRIIGYQVIVLPQSTTTYNERIREYILYEDGEIMYREDSGSWNSVGSAPDRMYSKEKIESDAS